MEDNEGSPIIPSTNEPSKQQQLSSKSSSSSSSSRRLKSTAATGGNNHTAANNSDSQLNGDDDGNIIIIDHSSSDNNTLKIKKKKKKRRSSTGELATNSESENGDTIIEGGGDEKKIKKKKSKQRDKVVRRASTRTSSLEASFGGNNSVSSNAIMDFENNHNSASDVDGVGVVGASSLSSVGGGGETKKLLRDSLTLSKEPKRQLQQQHQRSSSSTAASTQRRRSSDGNSANDDDDDDSADAAAALLTKQPSVQFTSSVLQRDTEKIGKQMTYEHDDNNNNIEDDETGEGGGGGGGDTMSVKSSESASSSGGSALRRTSKYGGGGRPKRTSFHLPRDDDYHDDDDDNDDDDYHDEKKDAADSITNPSSRGKFELRPSFKLNHDSTTNNNISNIHAETKPRGSRKEMFQRAASKQSSLTLGDTSNASSLGGGGTRRASVSSSFSAPQDDDDDDASPLKRSKSMSELSQRPVISRRSSCKSITNEIDGADRSSHSSVLAQKMNVVKSFTHSHHKQVRRVQMSMEKQIFIPPKNRNKSVISVFSHLMAGRVVDCVLWTYQAGFGKVLLLFLTFYVVNIFLWAGVIDAVDRSTGGRCIHDESFDPSAYTSLERYEFAFELSWTTFTTVGYGAIGPASDVPRCYPIRLVCAFVAFTGVLFGSTTAAIMYSKLMRLLAKAHVTFSSTLCVQYGKGNEGSTVRFGQFNFRASVAPAMAMKAISVQDLMDDNSDSYDDKREESSGASDDGFPVIEFRMVNDRANHAGSEIWDAQISGIIQLKKHVNPSNTPYVKATGGESTLDLDKKAYYQFALTPDSHPHFSRIWYARHVLNAESPLLKREIRDMIVQDGGKWDKDFNTASDIRQCLNEFISLRITLSGTSAVSANTVFAEHVYEYDDVVVGWRFANMVYEKEPKGRLWRRLFGFGGGAAAAEAKGNSETYTKVDKALIHDIVPQPGDDYEDLHETSALHHFSGLFKRS